jgi:hypothetical protein
VRYQWYRGGRAIKGATKATYLLRPTDRGKRLTVKVKVAGKVLVSAKTQPIR